MRSQSIYDRDGNSYRYCREVHRVKEIEERQAQDKKWCDLYKKASNLAEKDMYTDKLDLSTDAE